MRFSTPCCAVRNLDVAMKFYQDALGLEGATTAASTTTRAGSHAGVPVLAPRTRACSRPPPRTAALRWSSSPTIGTRRNTARTAISPPSPMRSTIIYATCDRLMKAGITINRPPRDGNMAFSPPLARSAFDRADCRRASRSRRREPWTSMPQHRSTR